MKNKLEAYNVYPEKEEWYFRTSVIGNPLGYAATLFIYKKETFRNEKSLFYPQFLFLFH